MFFHSRRLRLSLLRFKSYRIFSLRHITAFRERLERLKEAGEDLSEEEEAKMRAMMDRENEIDAEEPEAPPHLNGKVRAGFKC